MAATYSSLVGLAVGGKYEVRRVLGAGGMGVVCEAIHRDLGKKVALKLIDKSMKESELIVSRFRVEAKALGSIKSEHIVEVFDVEADPRVGLYMVMEHLSGEDLQTRMEREKRIDVKSCVMIAHQIARGLAKAHSAGVVHRDLKPANVFLTQRDNGQMLVKLLDFGVSKILAEEGGSRITGAGAPIGTPLYMSPEQAEGKEDTDARADIWSLGALMYEALSGTPPFQDRGSYHGTIVGILTSRPKLLHDAAPWVPAELARVVDAMLVHDRDARIKDAASVTQRLLEAYPAVLPDGTGRHTAVIVPQATAAVDATGDTDFFSSADMPVDLRKRRSKPSGEDSSRTVPEVGTGPGAPQTDATRTAAATPVDMGREPSSPPLASGTTAKAQSVSSIPSSGTRTAPLPWGGPTSSAGGVAMPGTPPLIDPLPMSQTPDTMRDDNLAVRAERRRWLGFAAVAIVITGVAVGGYVAGRRASEKAAASSTATTPAPPTATATPTATASATPTATATASAAPTASAIPETSAKRPVLKRPRAPARPAESATDGPPKDTPPSNPYDTPPP
ncbi:MAG TPA: serine/threonine-protein kinase [Labilithrix sp.]